MREVDQLGVGHEDAEHVDLDHRPGPQRLLQPQQPRQVSRAGCAPRPGQHGEVECDHHARHQHAGEQHHEPHRRQRPRRVPQCYRSGQDIDRVQPAEQVQRHQRHAEHDAVQHQRGHVERQGQAGGILARASQPGRAARAAHRLAGSAFGHDLEQPAVGAFAQSGDDAHGGICGRTTVRGNGSDASVSWSSGDAVLRPRPALVNRRPRLRFQARPCKTPDGPKRHAPT